MSEQLVDLKCAPCAPAPLDDASPSEGQKQLERLLGVLLQFADVRRRLDETASSIGVPGTFSPSIGAGATKSTTFFDGLTVLIDRLEHEANSLGESVDAIAGHF